MKAAYTRIKKPRRVTDDPVIYVCSPYAADPERNARRAENFCRYVWKMGGIPLAPHLLFPRFMNENRHKEREAGLRMARKLLGMCDEMWCSATRSARAWSARSSRRRPAASRSITTTAPSP